MDKVVNTTQSHNRISWIDNAKAIGIVLVWHGHGLETIFLNGGYNVVDYYKFLTSYMLSFFFVISGYTWKPLSINLYHFMKKMFISRFIPVVFFNILGLVLFIVISAIQQNLDIYQHVRGMMRLFLTGSPVYCFPMWFVVCLMMVEIIHFKLHIMIRTRVRLLISIVFFMLFGWIVTDNMAKITDPLGLKIDFWYVGEALVASCFFQIGILLKREQWLTKSLPKPLEVLMFVVALAITYVTYNLNQGPFKAILGFVTMALSSHGNMFWFFITSISGTVMTIYLAKLIPANTYLGFVGQYSIGFLGLNGLFYHHINGLILPDWIEKTNGEMGATIVLSTSVSLLTLIACMPLVYLFRSRIPMVLGR